MQFLKGTILGASVALGIVGVACSEAHERVAPSPSQPVSLTLHVHVHARVAPPPSEQPEDYEADEEVFPGELDGSAPFVGQVTVRPPREPDDETLATSNVMYGAAEGGP